MISPAGKRKLQNAAVIAGVLLVFLWLAFLFLTTESAIKSIWLPLVEKNTGTRISVGKCSFSIFRKNTFDASELKITGDGLDLFIPEIRLQANLFVPVFTGKLKITDLQLTEPELKLTPYSAESGEKPPVEKKSSDAKEKTKSFPVEIVHFKASGAAISFRSKSAYGFSVQKADLELCDFIPGKSASMITDGMISSDLEFLKIEHTEFHSNLKFTVPENGFLPKTFSLNLKSEKASVSSANFQSKNTALAMIAEFALEGTKFLLRSCSVSVSSEDAGDILAIRMTGSLNSDLTAGSFHGNVKIFSSPLVDTLLSEPVSARLSGVRANSSFSVNIRHGHLDSKIYVFVSAASIQHKSGKTQPVRDLSLRSEVFFTGIPAEQTYRLHFSQLRLLQEEHPLFQFSAPSTRYPPYKSWEFLKNGKLSLFPLPGAWHINAQKFPLNLFVAFGLDPKYEKETVSFSSFAGLNTAKEHIFIVKCSTSFPVLGPGPFSANFYAIKTAEGMTLRSGTLSCGTKEDSISARITGSFLEKSHAFELSSKWQILHPEKIFPKGAFEPGKAVAPSLSLSGNWNPQNGTFHFWAGGAGGAFRTDLNGEGILPEENHQVLALKQLQLACTAGEKNCLRLTAAGTIPVNGMFRGMSGQLNLLEFDPVLFRYLPAFLPERFDLSSVKPELSLQIREKKGIPSAEVHFAAKNILVKKQKDAPPVKWDADFSASAEFREKLLTLSHAALQSSLAGKPALHANLSGTVPFGEKPQKITLSLVSDRMDLSALQTLFAEEQQAEPKAPSPVSSEKEVYQPADLSPWDGSSLQFNLRNITCPGNLAAKCPGVLRIKQKTICLSSNAELGEKGLFQIQAVLDPSAKKGCDFQTVLSCRNCRIESFCKVFSPQPLEYAGNLDSASIRLKGCGFSENQFKRNAQGTLQMKLSDLTIPIQKDRQIILTRILALPIQGSALLLENNPKLAQSKAGKRFRERTQLLSGVSSGRRPLTFASGSADLSLENGILRVKSIRVQDGMVKSEELQGELNLLEENAQISSKMEIGEYLIPVEVYGTFQDLKVDYSKSAKRLLEENMKNLLKKENMQNAAEAVGDFLRNFQ